MTDTPTPERGASVEIEPQSSFLRPQDFSEDFSHENGNYQCRCYRCGHTFVGHKRRVTCKLCVTIDALTYERDALAAECARKDAEIAELREALAGVVSDLESEVDQRYHFPDVPPSQRNRYNRDMSIVRQAQTLLNPGAPRDGE